MAPVTDAFRELMSYFSIQFNIYVILLLIFLINCVKVVLRYYSAKKDAACRSPRSNSVYGYDLIITFLALAGLVYAYFFQGILADIASEQSHLWNGKVSFVCIAVVILAIVQFVISYKLSKLPAGDSSEPN